MSKNTIRRLQACCEAFIKGKLRLATVEQFLCLYSTHTIDKVQTFHNRGYGVDGIDIVDALAGSKAFYWMFQRISRFGQQ